MLTEFPSDALLLSRSSDPDRFFDKKARIIQKYIHKLERPAMPNQDHPLCDVYNDDVAVALACIAAISWAMSDNNLLGVSTFPGAIHSRLGSIGLPLLDWCLWVLKDISFAFNNCPIHNTTRIDAAPDALAVLSAFISDQSGLQLVMRRQEVVDVVVHVWASVAGLAFSRGAAVPSLILLEQLLNTPQLHDRVVESVARYTPTLPLQILRHVAAFSHRDFEPLPDPTLRRLPVEVHIEFMTQLCRILPRECTALFILHNAPKWVCRAFARVLTIPLEDWQGSAEVLMDPFRMILEFFQKLFELDPSYISMKAALRHRLVECLVRCVSEISRQKRLRQGIHSCAPVLIEVLQQVCLGGKTSGTILRLACRAMDGLDLAEEEKEKALFVLGDEEWARCWAAWEVLKQIITTSRKDWVVDPNARSGSRCMNPKCTAPYAHLKRCTDCHVLVVCSRACQRYMWGVLHHRWRCHNFERCYLAVVEKDERHDTHNCLGSYLP